jgi:hypothetical protein
VLSKYYRTRCPYHNCTVLDCSLAKSSFLVPRAPSLWSSHRGLVAGAARPPAKSFMAVAGVRGATRRTAAHCIVVWARASNSELKVTEPAPYVPSSKPIHSWLSWPDRRHYCEQSSFANDVIAWGPSSLPKACGITACLPAGPSDRT